MAARRPAAVAVLRWPAPPPRLSGELLGLAYGRFVIAQVPSRSAAVCWMFTKRVCGSAPK